MQVIHQQIQEFKKSCAVLQTKVWGFCDFTTNDYVKRKIKVMS